jgi:hypothetical protein
MYRSTNEHRNLGFDSEFLQFYDKGAETLAYVHPTFVAPQKTDPCEFQQKRTHLDALMLAPLRTTWYDCSFGGD